MERNSTKITYSTAGGRVVGSTGERAPEDQGVRNIPGVELLDHASGPGLGDGHGQGEVDEEGDGGD